MATKMHRRSFLKAAIASSLPFSLNSKQSYANEYSLAAKSTYFISAIKNRHGQHKLIFINHKGTEIHSQLNSIDLPSRGHSFSFNSVDRHIIAIARRPGNYILILNQYGETVHTIKAQNNRHFYGHAAIDIQGNYVYTTENNFRTGEGIIGVYSIKKNYQRIKEYSSYGIGPHDIKISHNNSHLLVANGGVQTHPESGRKKLNIKSMQPSLVYIDKNNGKLVKRITLPETDRFNSIRHFDLSKNGTVYISLQNQINQSLQTLICLYKPNNDAIVKCAIPTLIEKTLNHYIGDIALDKSEQFFAASSPRGGQILIFKHNGVFLQNMLVDDVCGISKTQNNNEFLITSGIGKVFNLRLNKNSSKQQSTFSLFELNQLNGKYCDNHLIKLA
jgi:hypothetical protein